MKYIVMECHSAYSVLMGEDSTFVKAANLRYEVGQTVEDPMIMEPADKKPKITLSRSVKKWAAAAAACLVLFGGYGLYYYNSNYSPYSYIIIEADAQVKLELNSKGEVISVIPLNDLGRELLSGYTPESGADEQKVAGDIVDILIKHGCINEGDTVSFFIDAPKDNIYRDYESGLLGLGSRHGGISFKTRIDHFDNDKNDRDALPTIKDDTGSDKVTSSAGGRGQTSQTTASVQDNAGPAQSRAVTKPKLTYPNDRNDSRTNERGREYDFDDDDGGSTISPRTPEYDPNDAREKQQEQREKEQERQREQSERQQEQREKEQERQREQSERQQEQREKEQERQREQSERQQEQREKEQERRREQSERQQEQREKEQERQREQSERQQEQREKEQERQYPNDDADESLDYERTEGFEEPAEPDDVQD